MDFAQALDLLNRGFIVRREKWPGDMLLRLEKGALTRTPGCSAVLSSDDILATDWNLNLVEQPFHEVAKELFSGGRVARRAWVIGNPTRMWLRVSRAGDSPEIQPSRVVLLVDSRDGLIWRRWETADTDMLATDWVVLKD